MVGYEQEDSQSDQPRLLVILGPTAVGKTSLSLEVAERFGGEIVSADSRLFYRGLDIGTDKPGPAELSLVKHHLVDICSPDETLTLGQYQRLAYRAIEEIIGRKKLPILVGGTGLYVRALLEGWTIPEVPPQEALREELTRLDQDELSRWLRELDRRSAERIDPRNIRRVIRALEVVLTKGVPWSRLRRKSPPNYLVTKVGLTLDRDILYQRIDARVDQMMDQGLLEEVIALKRRGHDERTSSMSGLGYRQLLAYLAGELALDEAVERIKYETHRFVRQQYNWFRLDDESINWFDTGDQYWMEKTIAFVGDLLGYEIRANGQD